MLPWLRMIHKPRTNFKKIAGLATKWSQCVSKRRNDIVGEVRDAWWWRSLSITSRKTMVTAICRKAIRASMVVDYFATHNWWN